MNALRFCSAVLIVTATASAQNDTTRHGWPVTPFFETHPITGVFGEFRNTLSSDHFHNGVDIPKPDGSPVYPVYNGIVTSIGTVASSGTDAFVRVRYNVSGLTKSDAYVHMDRIRCSMLVIRCMPIRRFSGTSSQDSGTFISLTATSGPR